MDLLLIRIIKELLELYHYIMTEELAERIGISLSSVRHRMSRVKEEFQKYGIVIDTVPRKGMRLEASESQRSTMYHHLHALAGSTPEIREYRKDYILKTLFEYSDNYTVQLFAQELFVSKKIISKDLREVEEFLTKFHVQLVVRRKSGILMKGNEFDVRQAIIAHYNSLWWHKKYDEKPSAVDPRISRKTWTYMNQMYGDLDLTQIQKLLSLTEQELELVWTDIAFSRLWEYIVVSKRRMEKGWMIETVHHHRLLPVEEIYIHAAGKLLARVTEKKVPAQEVQYLAARIYIAETVQPRIGANGEQFQRSVKRYLRQIGQIISSGDFIEDVGLIQKLCEMLSVIQYKRNYNITDWTDINKEVKKNLSELYGVCLTQMHVLSENTGLSFRQDDVAQIAIFIKNYLQKHRRKAIFVTATDRESADYQLNKLKYFFPDIYFSGGVHYQKFCPNSCLEDIVISTVDLKLENQNVYKITKHVNEEDIARLAREFEKEWEEVEYWKDYLCEDLVWEVNARNKSDAITQVCEALREKEMISETFEEKLRGQEAIIATAIGNRMAIPHVFDASVIEKFIAVVRLKHRILWDQEERVDILFVISAKPEQIPEVSSFLLKCKELYGKYSKISK